MMDDSKFSVKNEDAGIWCFKDEPFPCVFQRFFWTCFDILHSNCCLFSQISWSLRERQMPQVSTDLKLWCFAWKVTETVMYEVHTDEVHLRSTPFRHMCLWHKILNFQTLETVRPMDTQMLRDNFLWCKISLSLLWSVKSYHTLLGGPVFWDTQYTDSIHKYLSMHNGSVFIIINYY